MKMSKSNVRIGEKKSGEKEMEDERGKIAS